LFGTHLPGQEDLWGDRAEDAHREDSRRMSSIVYINIQSGEFVDDLMTVVDELIVVAKTARYSIFDQHQTVEQL
jgi:hypothetical protein